MKARVCLATDSMEPSGVGEHMLLLAEEIGAHYDLSFTCSPTPAGARLLDRAALMGLETFPSAARGSPNERAHLEARLRQIKPDLLHAHAGIGWEGQELCLAARAAGVGTVLRTEHLPYLLTDPAQQQRYRRMVDVVDGIICVSDGAHASFLEAGIPPDSVHVVRNGVRQPATSSGRGAVRMALGLPEDALIVLTVGRMTPQKGYADLLRAVGPIVERVPRAHFLWVGDGPLYEELRAAVHQHGLERALSMLGHRDDVQALMAAADLFVLPSRFEGLPLVILEAMAAAVPVVGTRVVGLAETVEDGVTGRLVEPGDDAALVHAIAEALDQPEQRARWARAGYRRYATHFTAQRMARETTAIYERLLAGNRPNRAGDKSVTGRFAEESQ